MSHNKPHPWRRLVAKTQRLAAQSPLLARTALKIAHQGEMVLWHRLHSGFDMRHNGERLLLETVADHCSCVTDVGANRGDWSQLWLSANPQAGLLLIEPASLYRQRLEKLSTKFPDSRVFPVAASDRAGTKSLVYTKGKEPLARLSSKANEGEPVSVKRLDSLWKEFAAKRCDFVKIDAEGSDFPVIRGMGKYLRAGKIPLIQFEYCPTWRHQGETLLACLQVLEKYGYQVRLIRADGLWEYPYEQVGELFRYLNFAAFTEEGKQWVEPILRQGDLL